MSTCTTFNPHESTGGSGVVPPGVPGHPLIATLAREQAIEGNTGTCEVKWATGWPATSKVYISVTSNSGPWTKVVDNAAVVFEHSFTFSALGSQQHWYYVESTSDVAGLESSSVQTFDADGNPHVLGSTMGKELACEGLLGTAQVIWSTGAPATSKIYASIISPTGAWTTVIDDATLAFDHDFTFPILSIAATHYFYTESVSDRFGTEQSSVEIFCTGSSVTISPLGTLLANASLSTKTKVTLLGEGSNLLTSVNTDKEEESATMSDSSGILSILTKISLTGDAEDISSGYASHSTV